MSKVHVNQPHRLGRAEARQKLQSFEDMLKKYRVSLDWKGDTAAVKGMGVSGDVAITDDAVEVSLQLGMIARAAGVDATRLQASIARRLGEAFGA